MPSPNKDKTRSLRFLYIAICIAILALSFERFVSFQYQKHAKELLQQTQQYAVSRLDDWYKSRQKNVVLIAQQQLVLDAYLALNELAVALDKLRHAQTQKNLRQYLAPLILRNGYLGYFLINKQKLSLASLRDSNIGTQNLLAEQKATFALLDSGNTAVSSIVLSDVPLPDLVGVLREGMATKFVLAPIVDNKEVIGYFAARINISNEFSNIMRLSRGGLTGETYIFNDQGKMLSESLFSDQLETIGLLETDQNAALNLLLKDPGVDLTQSNLVPRRNIALPLTYMAERATRGERGINLDGYRDYRGKPVIGTWQWLDEYDFGIATEMDVDEAYAELYQIRWGILVSVIVAIFMLIVYDLFFGKRQKELERRQSYLGSIMENSGDGIIVVDTHSVIELINNAVAEIFGYSRQELVGQRLEKLIPPRDREFHHRLVVSSTIESSKRIAGNRLLFGLHKSGKEIAIELNVSSVETLEGRKFIGVVRDITVRCDAESQVTRFKNVLDNALDCVFMFDPETLRFTYVNRGAVEQVGYSSQELLQMTPVDIKPQFDESQFREMAARIRTSRQQQGTFQTVHRHKDGADVPVEISLQYMQHEHAQPLFVAFVRDISERLASEEALRRRERMLNSVLDTSVTSIVLLDENGRVKEINNTWRKVSDLLTDPKRIQWIGNVFVDLLEDWPSESPVHQDIGQIRSALQEVIAAERNVWEGQIELPSREGRIYFQVYAKTVHDVPGTRCVIKMLDITEFVKTQQQLTRLSEEAIQATSAKSRFLATMSHEIRTPMNGVVGMIDLLRRTSLSNEQLEMVNTVRSSANALLLIINDILDLSKIESHALVLEEIPYSIADVVDSVGETLWPQAAAQSVSLLLSPAADGPEQLLGDPTRMRQILLNLLSNAIKFSAGLDREGVVSLKYEFAQHPQFYELLVKVEDNGIGMSAEQVANLFTPYSQADTSTTRQYGGTGLGLNICHNLTELMNGRIQVFSESGKGSCFELRLPVRAVKNTDESKWTSLANDQFAVVYQPQEMVLAKHIETLLGSRQASVKLFEAAEIEDIGVLHGYFVLTMPQVDYRALFIDSDHKKRGYKGIALVADLTQDKRSGDHFMQLASHPLKMRKLFKAIDQLSGKVGLELLVPHLDDSSEPVEQSQDLVQRSQHHEKILLVEDHAVNRRIIQDQLKLLGYSYESAINGKQAFALWQQGSFDFVLTDCHMPVMDGYQLAEKIRQFEKQHNVLNPVPIIAITANVLVGDAERCLAAGMNGHITKPIELEQIERVLRTWLSVDEDLSQPTPDLPFDFNVIQAQMGSVDAQLINALLADYVASAKADREQLLSAFNEKDLSSVKAQAHAAKGAARMVGAKALVSALEALEQLTSSEDWSGIAERLLDVSECFDQIDLWASENISAEI